MVAKVQQIRSLQDPDAVAQTIGTQYQDWHTQRGPKVAEWKELRNYIFATDTRTTSVDDNTDWKNSTTIPKITQIRDNLHANYRAALFSNDDWLRWEGYSEEAVIKTKRDAIETYIKNKVRTSDFEQTVEQLLYDYIDYGNAFAEVIFVNESKVDPITKETIAGYIGPKLVRLSPLDQVFNPAAPSYKSSPKITRYIKSIGELNEELQSRPELKYLPEAIKKAEDYRGSLSSFDLADIDKSEGFTVDGFGSLSQYYSSGYVEILEFEGDIYDPISGEFLKDHVITVIDRKWILRKEPSSSWLGGGTKLHVGWRTRPDNLYAMGPLDNLVGLQYRVDHLENLKADALDMTIHPPIKVIGDVPVFSWGPNEVIQVPDADGDVVPMPPNMAALSVNNEIQYLMSLMEEMAGAPKEAMGIRTPGEKTMFEVQQLQNAAGRIFQDKISRFEKYFLEEALNNMLETGRRNLDGVDVARVMDDDLGVVEFLNLTREDITAEGKLRPTGARHFVAQAQFMQNLVGVYGSPIADIVKPHTSGIKMAQMIEDIFGIERFELMKANIAVVEQADAARLAQTLQDQVQAESTVDTLGDQDATEEI